ncbi:MAG TPA: hypothetical protein VIY09_06655, partial [Rhizomicrobium sp.]
MAVTLTALCELVWVLAQGVQDSIPGSRQRAAPAHRQRQCGNEPAGRSGGIGHADLSGDFADGVIAYEGNWLGSEKISVIREERRETHTGRRVKCPTAGMRRDILRAQEFGIRALIRGRDNRGDSA